VRGYGPELAAYQLGHTDPNLVIRRYGKPFQGALDRLKRATRMGRGSCRGGPRMSSAHTAIPRNGSASSLKEPRPTADNIPDLQKLHCFQYRR
jgi:hypothetical protein